MRNGKGRWWKRFCKFREAKKKGKKLSNRMDEVQGPTDSDEESELKMRRIFLRRKQR